MDGSGILFFNFLNFFLCGGGGGRVRVYVPEKYSVGI